MAKGKKTRPAEESEIPAGTPPSFGGPTGPGSGVETTGRFMIIFKPGAQDTASVRSVLSKVAGIKDVAGTSDFKGVEFSTAALEDSDTMHFEMSGVVRVSADAVQSMAMSFSSDTDSPILAIEPELVCYTSAVPGFPPGVPIPVAVPILSPADYLRGYQEAVNHLTDRLAGFGTAGLVAGGASDAAGAGAAATFADNAQFTWGLQATGVNTSPFTGAGVKVAVLDTGMDLGHIDFAGRAVVSQGFTGVPVQDVFGHGTHCIGTACGSKQPSSGVRRYGIAHGSTIFVGKVFDNRPVPSAEMGAILAGIEWARTNGCQIVSLSLGAPGVAQQFQQYHMPTLLALNSGCLVIAAAGNNANRGPSFSGFRPDRPISNGVVEPPANADAVIAVAALDSQLRITAFSPRSTNVGVNGLGGIINISGPGFQVFSSAPGSGHRLDSGTSMATPHVAGIAALWCQATGDTGRALWTRLVSNVIPLNVMSSDCGAGLVRAPQSPT